MDELPLRRLGLKQQHYINPDDNNTRMHSIRATLPTKRLQISFYSFQSLRWVRPQVPYMSMITN